VTCSSPEIQPAESEVPASTQPQDEGKQEREPRADSVPPPSSPKGKSAAAMLEEVSLARDALQQELHVTKNALAAAEEHVQTTQAALAAEKDRVLKLEVELSEMQTKLQGMQELEVECRKYKQMLAERERKGAGIWGYVTGA
jgi:hypothetical protein